MSEQNKDEPRNADAQQDEVEDIDVPPEESDDVKGGGKVQMQDFHFVMRSNKSSP